jgi:hypothetical protein
MGFTAESARVAKRFGETEQPRHPGSGLRHRPCRRDWVEPSDATGVEPSEADPFASDRLPVSRANPRNTTSLSASAMRSYMDR